MRYFPDLTKDYEVKDLQLLKAKDWQLELLKKNPNYCSWGNHEDYMMTKENGGWNSSIELESFKDSWQLDDYNEVVNFYFQVYRKNHQCPHCEGSNYNKETKRLSDDWYDFDNTGRRWCSNITDIEVEALVKSNRLSDFFERGVYFEENENQWYKFVNKEKVKIEAPEYPSAKDVNDWNSRRGRFAKKPGLGHDAINRLICVEARAKYLGVYGNCEHCESGYLYDEPEARVGLQLWVLHPRKGASRGVYIKNIEENEVEDVLKYLKEAASRNANRFSKL